MLGWENLKNLKYQIFLLLSSICKDERIFKEEESIEILKILGLINNMWTTEWKKT